jgi:putative endonuclease
MTRSRQQTGRWGEEQAAQHLAAQGCEVLERNWRCPAGEVDLVVRDDTWLAFVEVRTRRGQRHGTPEESITPRKLAHMIAVAETYVYESAWDGDWRLDVVAVRARGQAVESIEWYKNVTQ